MATLPELLALIGQHDADSLQLRADHPPTLVVSREPRPLPAPPMTAGELALILDSVLSPAQRAALDQQGKAEGLWQSPRVGAFEFRARKLPAGLAVAFRPRDAGGTLTVEPPAASPPPAPATLSELLDQVVQTGASDLVVSCGTEATMRRAGEMRAVPGAVFRDDELIAALGPELTEKRRAELEATGSVDLAFDLPARGDRGACRFRVNVFKQRVGLSAVFRPIWDVVPTFEALNLPTELRALGELPYGLVLVTGPTGMGKSTTLSALIDHLNSTRSLHVITLEDPIEYLFRRRKCLIHQREVGIHVESFAAGLRAALRESPDVIFVGEMRDPDTIAAALTAAETGHLVLSTLHCGTPAQAVDRIIDTFPENQQAQVRLQLADVLRALVIQRLLPTTDGRGRVPIVELIRITYAFANLIRDRKSHLFASQIQSSRADGTLPFDESLARAVRAGRVALDEAQRVCRDPQHFRLLIGSSAGD